MPRGGILTGKGAITECLVTRHRHRHYSKSLFTGFFITLGTHRAVLNACIGGIECVPTSMQNRRIFLSDSFSMTEELILQRERISIFRMDLPFGPRQTNKQRFARHAMVCVGGRVVAYR